MWEFVFRFRFLSAAEARSLISIIQAARVFAIRAAAGNEASDIYLSPGRLAALLLANPPQLDADSIIIRTEPLSTEYMALLFFMLPLLSN
jgi:hypothetical protein